MTYTAFGPVADDVTDPGRLAAEIAALRTDLLAGTGLGLAETVDRALGGALDRREDVLFDQLQVLAFRAGAPELPCCPGDDDQAVAAWAEVVSSIARTGRLPG